VWFACAHVRVCLECVGVCSALQATEFQRMQWVVLNNTVSLTGYWAAAYFIDKRWCVCNACIPVASSLALTCAQRHQVAKRHGVSRPCCAANPCNCSFVTRLSPAAAALRRTVG
jgi:hypothetical protein